MANFHELLRVFEEGIVKDFPNKSLHFNGGDHLGFLDILVAANSCNYQAFEEALALDFEPKNHQTFLSWVDAMKSSPLVKQTVRPRDKQVPKSERSFSSHLKFNYF